MQHVPSTINQLKETSVCMNSMIIQNRVTLRKLTCQDLQFFWVWASDPDVAKTMTWDVYTTESEAQKFLKEIAENHDWFKAICFENTPVGSITLTQGKGNFNCKAELGYVIAKAYWNKGIVTEAVKQAIRLGFSELPIQRIEAFVEPSHIASQRVLTKGGMNFEAYLKNYMVFKGALQDRCLYSIVKDERYQNE